MNITAKLGALGAAIVALVMGLSACQTSGTVTSIVTDKGEETFTSWLAKPEGEGPFPAIVLLHGCSGTQWNTSHRTARRGLNGHARLLNDYGYVTLVVDGCQTGGKLLADRAMSRLLGRDWPRSLDEWEAMKEERSVPRVPRHT